MNGNKKYCAKRYVIVPVFLVSLFFVVCCTKEDRKTQVSDQIKSIDAYAAKAKESGERIAINRGSTRIVIKEGEGDTLSVGDSVYFDFAGYIFNSGIGTLFETNLDSIADISGLNINSRGFDYGKGIVGRGLFIRGLDNGLIGTCVGEHSYIVFPASLGFDNNDVGLVPKMSPLLYEVWIKDIKKN